jgi:hypothetical protein
MSSRRSLRISSRRLCSQAKVRSTTQPVAAQSRAVLARLVFREPPLRREFGGFDTPEQNDIHALL